MKKSETRAQPPQRGERFCIEFTAPLPLLGLEAGDIVTVDPGGRDPVVLYRSLPPDYETVADALTRGIAYPLNPDVSREDVLALLPVAPTPAPRRRTEGCPIARGHLSLVVPARRADRKRVTQ